MAAPGAGFRARSLAMRDAWIRVGPDLAGERARAYGGIRYAGSARERAIAIIWVKLD